jgi:high-affinity iron transporter
VKIRHLFFFCFFLLCCSSTPTAKPQDGPKEAHHLVSLLFYLETNYPKALQDDKEFELQKTISNDLQTIVKDLPTHERWEEPLQKIKTLIETKGPTEEVKTISRDLQRDLSKEYKLLLSPNEKPVSGRGESLFKIMCVDCHGKDGSANTPRGKQLKRPPASLIDETVIAPLSPYRVYDLLSFGLGEMPSFELASVEDRWALAFYIFALRYQNQSVSAEILSKLPSDLPKNFEALAKTSEQELRDLVKASGVTDVDAAMRALRVLAPYQ